MTSFARLMISPPFKECPVCHRTAFGVLRVSPLNYLRKCRECGHAYTFALPPPNKKIIYLDQWVWSNMRHALEQVHAQASLSAEAIFYRDLFLRLDRLTKLMLVVCPVAPVHSAEALGLIRVGPGNTPRPDDMQSHGRIVRLIGHLACGIRFEPSISIFERQALAALRVWLSGDGSALIARDDALVGDIDAWLPLIYGALDSTVGIDSAHALATSKAMFERNFALVANRWKSQQERGYSVWFNEECLAWARVVERAYEAREQHISYRRSRFGPNMGPGDPLADVMLLILDTISKHDRCDPAAAKQRATDFFASSVFRQIPIVRIASATWAGLAHQVQAGSWPPEASIGNDVDFISTYLPYCDAMLIEKRCASVLTMNPTAQDVPEHTHVYSGKTRDRFLAYLTELETTVSPAHRAQVQDVYGDDWDRPDLSYFFR